jgi:hypothetical protein
MRFGDLRARLDDISPALLTTRLNALVDAGVVRRAVLPAPFNAQVYELTEVGGAIQPAIRELIRWGGRFLFPMRKGETFEPDWVLLALEAIARHTPTSICRIDLRIPHPKGIVGFIIEGGPEGTRISNGESSGSATIEARFDVLLQILARQLTIDAAVANGDAKIDGSVHTLRKTANPV